MSRSWIGYTFYGALLGGMAGAFYLVGRRRRPAPDMRLDPDGQHPVTDPATGLYNRGGMQRITEGLFANEQIKSGVCVMLLCIDHYKTIHDSRGTEAAGRVIQQVVDLVIANVRRGDHFGRWGNDEFLLLFSGASEEGAVQLARKTNQAVAEHKFEAGADPLAVTVSIGIALARPDETFGQTLKRADTSISRVKAEGHNGAVLAES